jgi:hypothetical protein
MRAVFEQAMGEARTRGKLAVICLVWRELRDAPGALIREYLEERRIWEMGTLPTARTGNTRSTWSETLAGLFPFLLLGPATVLLAYPFPPPEWRMTGWAQTLITLLYVVPLLVGAIVGWLKGFPRWCYAYLGPGVIILAFAAINSIFAVLFSRGVEWHASLPGQIGTTVGIVALLVGLVMLLSRLLPFLRPFYSGVRQDWTRLSFSLYVLAAVMFGGIDHEEDPALTFFVLSPSLMVVLGALAYLRGTTERQRIVALMLGAMLAVTVRIVGGKGFYVFYGIIIGLILCIPALLELIPRSRLEPQKPD